VNLSALTGTVYSRPAITANRSATEPVDPDPPAEVNSVSVAPAATIAALIAARVSDRPSSTREIKSSDTPKRSDAVHDSTALVRYAADTANVTGLLEASDITPAEPCTVLVRITAGPAGTAVTEGPPVAAMINACDAGSLIATANVAAVDTSEPETGKDSNS
jgi:hypothetical protein